MAARRKRDPRRYEALQKRRAEVAAHAALIDHTFQLPADARERWRDLEFAAQPLGVWVVRAWLTRGEGGAPIVARADLIFRRADLSEEQPASGAEAVPPGGLSNRIVRLAEKQLSQLVREEYASLHKLLTWPRLPAGAKDLLGLDADKIEKARPVQPGRRPLSDEELAYTASVYLKCVGSTVPPGKREGPMQRAADELSMSEYQVRKRLYRAQLRGLKTEPPPGKAGGPLTEKGNRALARYHAQQHKRGRKKR